MRVCVCMSRCHLRCRPRAEAVLWRQASPLCVWLQPDVRSERLGIEEAWLERDVGIDFVDHTQSRSYACPSNLNSPMVSDLRSRTDARTWLCSAPDRRGVKCWARQDKIPPILKKRASIFLVHDTSGCAFRRHTATYPLRAPPLPRLCLSMYSESWMDWCFPPCAMLCREYLFVRMIGRFVFYERSNRPSGAKVRSARVRCLDRTLVLYCFSP